ncbi:MAG: sigma-54-dependent transcriptional regulator [Nitratireductor sp.]
MSDMPKVYLVDDDVDFREVTKELLDGEGLQTRTFVKGEELLAQIEPKWSGVILSDVKMPGMDGFELLSAVKKAAPDVPIVMMTGYGDIPMAVEAVKAGAYGFLEKPIQPEYLLSQLRQALNNRNLILENRRLRNRVEKFSALGIRLIGTSRAMKLCRKELQDIANLPLPVLIYGEPGTGKEAAAREVHNFCETEDEFITINCGTVTESNFRSLLDLNASNSNTFFLRALHQLPLPLQNILSGFLRLGSGARVITSLTGSLESCLIDETLSEELYYLLNVAVIKMPALRDREKDIFLLFESFMHDASNRFGKKRRMISTEQMQNLRNYNWPGNVRELRNVADRFVLGLPVELKTRSRVKEIYQNTTYEQTMYSFEKSFLEHTLIETGGHKGDAAKLLSIPRKRLYLRLKAVGLSK